MKKISAFFVSAMAAAALSASAEAPSGYYDCCEGLSGKNLLTKLCAVVGSHTTISYNGLWDAYKTTDVDENGKIWDMYSSRRWTPGSNQCGSYSNVGDCYNREHSFPKSWFNDATPMYSDAFHLYPTDGKVNGQRSNFPYGECANGTRLASHNGYNALGRLGESTFPGYSGKVFEPDDEYKGDFARSYFYMAAAYNDRIAGWNSDMLAHNSFPAFSDWAINLLLKWHRQDPVSQKELDRNEAVYALQHNRNPFIDHPELAEYIWGTNASSPWHPGGDKTPILIAPSDGTTVDFGANAVGITQTMYLTIQGSNLTEALSVAVKGDGFASNATSVSAASANNRVNLAITWKPSKTGVATGTLRLMSSEVSVSVNLRGEAVDGIPALSASNVDLTSFTARWVDLGDEEFYDLIVKENGRDLPGFPEEVRADFEEYDIEGLIPGTTYTYQLKSSTKVSNIVTVTTLSPIISIDYVSDEDVELFTTPLKPSEAAEMWIDTDNVDSEMVVTVSAPFEVSTDRTNWALTTTLKPEEDRFYLRVGATEMGTYFTSVVITTNGYLNDDATATAYVRDSSVAWFVEDFEAAVEGAFGSYGDYIYNGKHADWALNDCGIFANETSYRRNGQFSVRFGNSSSSSITTCAPKEGGISTVSFQASKWSDSDGNLIIDVQFSADGDQWISAGTVTVDGTELEPYSLTVNQPGSNFIRLQQVGGKRGNIDDISVTDYNTDGIELVEGVESWDSYSLNVMLVITNSAAPRRFHVYNLEGVTMGAPVVTTTATLRLPAGLYIVTDGSTSRRVVVK